MDIIAAIDQATGCQRCGGPLGDSPSDDFCGQECQQAWAAARTVPLVGYREPYAFGPEDYQDVPRRRVTGSSPAGFVTGSAELFTAPVGTPPLPGIDVQWEPFGHLAGDVVHSGLGFDGAPDAPLSHFEVLRGGEIRVNILADTDRFDAAVSRADTAVSGARDAMARLGQEVLASTTPDGPSLLDDLRRWAQIYLAESPWLGEEYERSFAAMREAAVYGRSALLCSPHPEDPTRAVLRYDGEYWVDEATSGPTTDRVLDELARPGEEHDRRAGQQARALDARRNRGTGPARRERPPRTINARGAR